MGLGSSLDLDVRLNTDLSPEERARFQDSRTILEILRTSRTAAVVGLSTEKTKASSMVASYLRDEGYEVIPIHPKAAEIMGARAYPSLLALDRPVDLVVVFRPAGEVAGIVDQFLQIDAKALWLQLRIIDIPSAQRVLDAGRKAVVDRCVKIEHGRRCGSLHWAGMNTEVISARKQR